MKPKKTMVEGIVTNGVKDLVRALLNNEKLYDLNKRLCALRERLIAVGIVEREKGESDED